MKHRLEGPKLVLPEAQWQGTCWPRLLLGAEQPGDGVYSEKDRLRDNASSLMAFLVTLRGFANGK